MYQNINKIYHAAIYVRLSKEDGDISSSAKLESNSISNQKALILDFLKDKKDIEVVSVRVDDGYSGSNFDRPAFQAMLEDIRRGIVDCVVVKDLSRFGREYIDSGKYIERLFPALGVRFIAINDNYDSLKGKNQADEIIIPFKNLINDAYCRDISIKIRSNLEIKRKKGECVTPFVAFGYRKTKTDKHKLEIDPSAGSVVQDIFKMKLQGMSQDAIANRLNELGILSPFEYKISNGSRYETGLKNMFKKNKKQTETIKEPKEKKVRTVKVGTHKKTVIALWVVLVASVSFGVYKNFTAIDQHTTHEKEIIELCLQDTNGIENFVKNFAKSYYTWDNSKEAIEARTQAISGYLTKELQDLNVDTIRTDIPTSSTVTDVIVWHIEQSGADTFSATYEVDQQIKEGEQTSNVKATYTVKVHVDADGDMVIVQNPTLAPAIEKSDYEPKTPEADASVDADTTNDATAFLETFFKLYPTATEKELTYYVSGNVLEPIGMDYLYSELVNPIFTKDGDNVKVKVAVKFLDNQTKATQVSQYELVLHKDSNWKIVG